MRALDPRLLLYARATRAFLVVSVLLGLLSGLLIVAQAWLLADVVARAFIGGRGLAQLQAPLIALLGVVLARAVVAWGAELAASRSSARAKSQLRAALMERVAAVGLESGPRRRTGELAILATRGIDALDGYFSLYLPQLFLAVIVPAFVIAAVLWEDWISAAIIALTIPLIPLFMALVGASTQERMDRQLRTMQRLAGHFLDVVAGLGTLKVFGRAKAQAATIRDITERYRRAALSTLRITFLSSLILELVATISVALVAVAIGLRLLNGELGLRTALFALVLAPEAYLPLRRLGASYHASSEGMAAAEQVFAVLESPAPLAGGRTEFADPAAAGLTVEDLRVTYPGRSQPALDGASLSVQSGEITALVGPSGCGKSTLLGVLLGLVSAESGSVRVGGVDLAELDVEAWRAQLAWVPQRPHMFSASIAENVRLGNDAASKEEVRAAISAAGLAETVSRLPGRLDTVLGEHGAGLSAGERQRVALARAFLRDAPLLLLDEPTANLDGQTERDVVEAIRQLARGRTVLLVAHRPALIALADTVVSLEPVGAAA
ncbi:MAG TPA: thiol reductant ABC exporter subunit CydD [Solirubrobacteraceae bacterium]|nr:thiol reductant ABC exporter subunit CydD [Solirubrobacteraceae bacterium]